MASIADRIFMNTEEAAHATDTRRKCDKYLFLWNTGLAREIFSKSNKPFLTHNFGELKQKRDTPAEELESTEVKLQNPERVSF